MTQRTNCPSDYDIHKHSLAELIKQEQMRV